MTNIEILKKYKKTEILEILCRYIINETTEKSEKCAEHILWLYEEIDPSTEFWFFREEFYKKLNKELPFEEKEEPYV